MPRRDDIKKILIIGSGPIVIGQACEFDYSGTQACKSLKQEGYQVVLINSNPATIMTDPEIADATYIEPLTLECLERIIDKERPQAVLPTLGGQTALNLAMKGVEAGIFKKYGIELIGANYDVIKKAEDRECFKKTVVKIGLDVPKSGFAYNMEQAQRIAQKVKFPLIIRSSYTLGGTGGSIVYHEKDFERMAFLGLESSMIKEILIEESIAGWKEYELEVMRDCKDNVVIICSIENLDPMGVHTGDSITVAPAQTLTDKEYQEMRNQAIALIREIGVETGGCNVQFAVDPRNGRMVVIEVNPRVSRSSALASKATGFPIAKIAAKLAVGYSLDEIQNDITRETLACFEPTLDYCVTKIPRFTFEKFPEAGDTLGVSMKSVGETMAIGRTFKESLQKGLRGLEIGHAGLDNKLDYRDVPDEKIQARLQEPNASRIFYVKYALQKGMTVDEIYVLSNIDPWFLGNIKELVDFEGKMAEEMRRSETLSRQTMRQAKQFGFSDAQISYFMKTDEEQVRQLRQQQKIDPVYKLVDTCAAEFEAYTPYYYSTYEDEDERVSMELDQKNFKNKKIMILGGGPNRIGQGIEFDYCCCHASFALKELGCETIMVNSNPETVSTDYDTSDKLYFEPLTFEDVMNIVEAEKPDGIIVQFGGQTPLNLSRRLHEAGAPIIGTSVSSIDLAENREKFSSFIAGLELFQPKNGSAYDVRQAVMIAENIGYPVLARPSYVLGGRAMKIVYSKESLLSFIKEAEEVSGGHPILIDQFIEDAIEVDVDAISDGKNTFVAGMMEHIENAGIHSGDSACVLPPHTLSRTILNRIKKYTCDIAQGLNVIGLLNIQFAIKGEQIFVLEVNPRASRTVPFVSKATGTPLAKIASKVMLGKKVSEFLFVKPEDLQHISVKESVLPFSRFSGVDIVLGPEMKSTGEVMGIDMTFGAAFAKSQICANQNLPEKGKIFISVNDSDKRHIAFLAKKLSDMGFSIISTKGTARVLRTSGILTQEANKMNEAKDDLLEMIRKNEIQLIINTPSGERSQSDMRMIRSAASMRGIPCITTMQGAWAAVHGIETKKEKGFVIQPLQQYYQKKKAICAAS